VGRDAALAHALLRALPERWSSALLAARYGALLGRRAAP
jgi:hypothetical protein